MNNAISDENDKPTTAKTPPKSDRQTADWDIQNAPRNYLSLIATQGGSALFSLAAVWLLIGQLGKEGYGGIVAIIAASQLAQILVNWTVSAVLRFGVEEFVETGKITRIFWLRFLALIPQLLLALASSALWFSPLARWLQLSEGVYWYVVAHFIAASLWIHVQYGLQAAKLQRLQGLLIMMERLLVAAVVSALIYIGRLTDISAILAYSIVPLIIAAIGLWFLRGLAFSPFTFDRRLLWKIFAYSFPLFPYVILGYFTTGYLDAVFIAKFISIAELGVYAIALQVNGIALQLPTLANSLLIPLFVTLDKQDESQRTRAFFADVLPTLVLMWGIGCALISFLSYLAIPVFFSAEFYPSAKPLWILLSGSVAAFPVLVGWVALVHSSSKTQVALFAAAATAAVNVAGNFLLIPPLGIVGCAWATALSLLSAATVYGALLRRQVNLIVSWTFLAMAPGFGGALSLTLTDNIFWSLMVCLATSLLIAYLQKDSLLRTISLLISLAKR